MFELNLLDDYVYINIQAAKDIEDIVYHRIQAICTKYNVPVVLFKDALHGLPVYIEDIWCVSIQGEIRKCKAGKRYYWKDKISYTKAERLIKFKKEEVK